VVLGDLGRSPRMQYHARSLADAGASVDLLGYVDTELVEALQTHPCLNVHAIRQTATGGLVRRSQLLFVLRSMLRVSQATIQLMWILLFGLKRLDTILVQNPPSVPTLLVAMVAGRVRSAKFVVDWHNLGYSMLALRLGQRHPLVQLHRWFERTCGVKADHHLCVSAAMQSQLSRQWGIADPVLLYDRPAQGFEPTPPDEAAELLGRLRKELELPEEPKPLVWMVCPTSWTADEDMSLLLDVATRDYGDSMPDLAILITGKGPLRTAFERELESLPPSRIHLRTLWLAYREYQRLLGAANLGICLHRSSSKVDLPMKIVDMFGAGLPACALNYGPCLEELVQHRVNGLVFDGPAELNEQLCELFGRFPADTRMLDQLRQGVSRFREQSWDHTWQEKARTVLVST